MYFKNLLIGCFLCITGLQAQAADCSKWAMFSTSKPYLEPQSVALSDIQNHLNASQWSDGIIVDVEIKDAELWFDVVYFPETTRAVAAVRLIFQLGRLAKGEFDTLVFAEKGEGVFSVPETTIRDIGCQFIWGQEGGQNPIALMRQFFKDLRRYPDNQHVFTGFNGSLLGDTTKAMDVHNNIFLPEWVLSAVE